MSSGTTFCTGVLILVGALVALPALLHPVRRLCWRRPAARGIVMGLLALISFALSLAGLARLRAEATYVFGMMTLVDTFGPGEARIVTVTIVDMFEPEGARVAPQPEVGKSPVIKELWIQLLLPPPLRPSCCTGDWRVCTEANRMAAAAARAQWGWSAYGTNVGLASISLIANGILVWLFTRRTRLRQNQESADVETSRPLA